VSKIIEGWEKERHQRGPLCPSVLAFDRWLSGELPKFDKKTATHIEGCEGCKALRAGLLADREHFLRETNVPHLATALLGRAATEHAEGFFLRWIRRLFPAMGIAAAVATAVVVALPLTKTSPLEDTGVIPVEAPVIAPLPVEPTRTKGTLSLSLFVKRARSDETGSLHLGDPLASGDRVRFALTGSAGSQVAVFGIDTTGQISTYYPADETGKSAAAILDERGLLPNAVELDGTPGTEVIVALRCDQPFELEGARAALRQALDPGRARQDPAAALGRIDLPCAQARYQIQKAPGSGGR